MNNVLISVVIPCYNQGQYLSETLQSVLDQTYPHWECIIVNDGSTDDTDLVAKQWTAKDARFKYIPKENGGLSSARNKGLDIAIGEYIQFLDSDDILVSTKFEKSLNAINKENALVVVSNFKMFTNNRLESDEPFCVLKADYLNYENILFNWDDLFSIPIHCGFFHKFFFESFRFPIELKAKEDWIMWISVFKNNFKSVFLQDSLVLYRLHAKSMTQDEKFMQENLINSLIYQKNVINESDFDRLLRSRLIKFMNMIDNLNDEIISQKIKYRNLKDSNTFKLGFKIHYFLRKMKLLSFFKIVLKKLNNLYLCLP